MRAKPAESITGPISFSTSEPMSEGCAAAMTMAMSPPREVPMIAASWRPVSVMKSMTSSISIGTA